MKAHPIHLSALEAHEQALKLVDPGKGSFADKALLVRHLVEMTLPTTLWAFPIALILGNIGVTPRFHRNSRADLVSKPLSPLKTRLINPAQAH